MDLAKAGILGQAILLDPVEIALPYVCEMRRYERVFFPLFQPDLIEEMQLACHPRSGLVDDPFGCKLLTRLQYTARSEHRSMKVSSDLTAHGLGADFDALQ